MIFSAVDLPRSARLKARMVELSEATVGWFVELVDGSFIPSRCWLPMIIPWFIVFYSYQYTCQPVIRISSVHSRVFMAVSINGNLPSLVWWIRRAEHTFMGDQTLFRSDVVSTLLLFHAFSFCSLATLTSITNIKISVNSHTHMVSSHHGHGSCMMVTSELCFSVFALVSFIASSSATTFCATSRWRESQRAQNEVPGFWGSGPSPELALKPISGGVLK